MNSEKGDIKKGDIKKSNKALVLLLMTFIFLVGMSAYYIGKTASNSANIVKIGNVFADVNGDNLVDLIISADVVLNDGLDF